MPTVRLDALGAAVTMLAEIADPRERLRSIRALRSELDRQTTPLDELIAATVLELRSLDTPATWQEIGDLLNLTAQRAHQIAAEALHDRQRRRLSTLKAKENR